MDDVEGLPSTITGSISSMRVPSGSKSFNLMFAIDADSDLERTRVLLAVGLASIAGSDASMSGRQRSNRRPLTRNCTRRRLWP